MNTLEVKTLHPNTIHREAQNQKREILAETRTESQVLAGHDTVDFATELEEHLIARFGIQNEDSDRVTPSSTLLKLQFQS
jgi:hypothetical protein